MTERHGTVLTELSRKEVVLVEHKQPFRYEEDGLAVTRGSAWTAPGCHLGCGVVMYADKDNKLVKIEGDPENPYNQGRLCVRCLGLIEAVNHEDRLLYPMKRDRKDRGRNVFERITWEEALDTIEERFNYFKETYGAESVSFWQGTGR
ncbi:MAG: molybdopterin-dependent oxidoreductase, partial [Gordonibacter sp.]